MEILRQCGRLVSADKTRQTVCTNAAHRNTGEVLTMQFIGFLMLYIGMMLLIIFPLTFPIAIPLMILGIIVKEAKDDPPSGKK